MGSLRSTAVSWRASLLACATSALLAGCPTVDLGDTPTDIGLCNPAKGIDYFEAEVWPKFIRPANATNGCTKSGCHNEGSGNPPSFRGGTNPTATDFSFNYRQARSGSYLNCGNPEASPLRTRPMSTIDPHGGMDVFDPGSEPDMVFLAWFVE